MIEIVRNPHLGYYAGFANDYAFQNIKSGMPFIDDYVQREIDRWVTPESVCVDVGANLGYVSVYLSKRCKRLYSFEPQPIVFLQLCCNLFLNECFNVTPVNMGLYSEDTALDFAQYQSGWVGTSDFSDYTKIRSIGSISLKPDNAGPIKAVRGDTFFRSHGKLDFIKIDAQGADIDILMGFEAVLLRDRPVVVLEYENDLSAINYHKTLHDLNVFLERIGYAKTEIYEGNFLLTPVPASTQPITPPTTP